MSKGHTLVVADYGQLELRILAHMADCKSMINAFKLGGDFHSRTALGMYDHIKEAVSKGNWSCSKHIASPCKHMVMHIASPLQAHGNAQLVHRSPP